MTIPARWLAIMAALCALATQPCVAMPAEMESLDQAVCRTIERSAEAARLPVAFVTRVIWRESSFRAGVVSRAGAEGIAQFMPGTAQARGLADPFDPEQAIPKAARYLADLRQRFGNIGVAAAAYNSGEARVSNWLRGQGGLPNETRAYVRFVTGRSPEEWTSSGSSGGTSTETTVDPAEPQSCLTVTAELRRGGSTPGAVAAEIWAPWGVQLAGNFSKPLALAAFDRARARYASVIGNERPMIIGRLLRSRGTRPFYQVRLPAASRAVAEQLCGRIQSVGGACVALPSA